MKRIARRFTDEFSVLNGEDLKYMLMLGAGGWLVVGRAFLRRIADDAPRFQVDIAHGPAFAIGLEYTSAPLGGVRWWYTCPYCSGRCGKLYQREYDLGCRKCIGLHYRCQSLPALDRMMQRVRNKRYAIWGKDEPDVGNLMMSHTCFKRPKGMHREKFRNLVYELEDLEAEYIPMLLTELEHNYRGEYTPKQRRKKT